MIFITPVAQVLYTISNDEDMITIANHSWGVESLPRILTMLGFEIPSERDLVILETAIPKLFTKELKFFQKAPIRLTGFEIQ